MRNLKIAVLAFLAVLLFKQTQAQAQAPKTTVKLFFEKVFLHTDRSLYAPGESVWYKAYLVNARDNHLIETSKNLYVELINPADSLMNREIINLNKGTGKGDFTLPEHIRGGVYRLRAYTNWMRNFGDNFIFEKQITVTDGPVTGNISGGSKKQKNRPGMQIQDGNKTILRFFPEGGSLVNEVSALVAVKAEDALGNGVAISAPVISAAGDTIARFTCDSLGMGLFSILPIKGQTYYSSTTYRGQTLKTPLPEALSSGLSLKVLKRDTLLYITISCNTADTLKYAGKILTLTAKHAGQNYVEQQVQLKGNYTTLRLPTSLLPDGIAVLTLTDDERKPNCERLIYIDHAAKARLIINMAKNIYKSREKATVNIKITNSNHQPVSGDFSMSVFDAAIDRNERSNIAAYLMLQSEIKGQIIHAERYFDSTNVNRFKQLDLLLLTQGWRDFVWKKLADSALKISYLPEQGITLSGSVKKEAGYGPVTDANITLLMAGAPGQKLFFGKSNAKGNFYFDNLPLFGEQRIRATSRDAKGKAYGVIALDSLSKNSLPVNRAAILPDRVITAGLNAEMERRLYANRQLDSVTNLREVKIKGNANVVLRDQVALGYGYNDEVLTPTADDLQFKTLKDYILYKSNQAKPDPNGDQIVFFADGKTYKPRIIVDNKEAAFNEEDDDNTLAHYYGIYYELPMSSIEKVVIKRLLAGLQAPSISTSNAPANAMGNSRAGAGTNRAGKAIFIIYLTLKPGALLQHASSNTSTNIEGYYQTRSFYKPVHNVGAFDSQKPDMRTTINWEPQIKVDANGEATISFYNADPKTTIKVIVQGITETGTPLFGVSTYTVK